MTPQTGPTEPLRATLGDETADVVARAREALENVTDGPWEAQQYDDHPGDEGCGLLAGVGIAQRGIGYIGIYHWNSVEQSETDAAFVAAARSLIPELIAEVERLHSLPTTKDQQ